MKIKIGRWVIRILFGVAIVSVSVPAQSQTGFCALDCFTGLAACMGTTPGCTVTTSCAGRGACQSGLCSDGRPCDKIISAECAPCIEARGACILGCGDTFLPELDAGIRRAGLDEGQERALLVKIEQVQKELATGVERAVRSLEALQKHVAAQAGKGIDEKAAASLSEMAKRTAIALQGNGVAACVSAVTIVEGGPTPDTAAGKRMKK